MCVKAYEMKAMLCEKRPATSRKPAAAYDNRIIDMLEDPVGGMKLVSNASSPSTHTQGPFLLFFPIPPIHFPRSSSLFKHKKKKPMKELLPRSSPKSHPYG